MLIPEIAKVIRAYVHKAGTPFIRNEPELLIGRLGIDHPACSIQSIVG